jgi:hypothetical protein
LAVLADRHDEFLSRGARLYGISADSPAQNAAVIEMLALPFPVLSDESRQNAIEPLGLADPDDPRRIARTAVVVISPEGEEVFRYVGREYADRPHEDLLLEKVAELGLRRTEQAEPSVGTIEPGERAVGLDTLPHYFRGAKYAALALRRRHRDASDELRDDAKAYVQMIDRFLEALTNVEDRRS